MDEIPIIHWQEQHLYIDKNSEKFRSNLTILLILQERTFHKVHSVCTVIIVITTIIEYQTQWVITISCVTNKTNN